MIWYQGRVLTENGTQRFKPVHSLEQARAMLKSHRDNYTGDFATYRIVKMKQILKDINSDDSGTLSPDWILKPV